MAPQLAISTKTNDLSCLSHPATYVTRLQLEMACAKALHALFAEAPQLECTTPVARGRLHEIASDALKEAPLLPEAVEAITDRANAFGLKHSFVSRARHTRTVLEKKLREHNLNLARSLSVSFDPVTISVIFPDAYLERATKSLGTPCGGYIRGSPIIISGETNASDSLKHERIHNHTDQVTKILHRQRPCSDPDQRSIRALFSEIHEELLAELPLVDVTHTLSVADATLITRGAGSTLMRTTEVFKRLGEERLAQRCEELFAQSVNAFLDAKRLYPLDQIDRDHPLIALALVIPPTRWGELLDFVTP